MSARFAFTTRGISAWNAASAAASAGFGVSSSASVGISMVSVMDSHRLQVGRGQLVLAGVRRPGCWFQWGWAEADHVVPAAGAPHVEAASVRDHMPPRAEDT